MKRQQEPTREESQPKKQSKCRLSKGDSLYYGETSSVLRFFPNSSFPSSRALARKPSHEELFAPFYE